VSGHIPTWAALKVLTRAALKVLSWATPKVLTKVRGPSYIRHVTSRHGVVASAISVSLADVAV
jgi:hypothetical protein